MKRITNIFAIMIILIGCRQTHSSDYDCISYTDSLQINIDSNEIRVAVIDLFQEHLIRPYTSVYSNHLLVLNEADYFYSFSMDCFKRDHLFEQRINSQRFKKAFVISDTLYGIDSVNQAFRFDEDYNGWIKELQTLPLFNSIPIYESEKYICYSICHGEFGGIVFFYNKLNRIITFAPATCAVSIIEYENEFYIVSNLAHLVEGTDIVKIDNPDLLYVLPDSLYQPDRWNRITNYYPVLYDNSALNKHITTVYDECRQLITSGFRIKCGNYYLIKLEHNGKWSTYLSEFEDDSLKVISTHDTVFSSLPASRDEITRKYYETTIIDYTRLSNDLKSDRNIVETTFILSDSTLIRVNWINWDKW